MQKPEKKAFYVDFGGEIYELNAMTLHQAKEEAFILLRDHPARMYYGSSSTIKQNNKGYQYIWHHRMTYQMMQSCLYYLYRAAVYETGENTGKKFIGHVYLYSDDFRYYGLDPVRLRGEEGRPFVVKSGQHIEAEWDTDIPDIGWFHIKREVKERKGT